MGLADKYLLICLAKGLPPSWVSSLVNCFVKFPLVFSRVKKIAVQVEEIKIKKILLWKLLKTFCIT